MPDGIPRINRLTIFRWRSFATAQLNLVSIFTACKFALPYLRQTQGNIINMASLVATIGQRYATTYVATKGAITAFTKALAVDEAPNGVRVNSVSPETFLRRSGRKLSMLQPDPQQYRAEGEAAQLLGRMGCVEEVGRLCLFIAAASHLHHRTWTTSFPAGRNLAMRRKSVNGKVPEGELVLRPVLTGRTSVCD